jgi:hypothetical protein
MKGGSILLDNNTGLMFYDSAQTARTILTYSAANNLQLVNPASTGALQIGNLNNVSGNAIQFLTGSPSIVKMVINTDGNVGIGSSTPNATLVVQGTSSAPTLDVLKISSSTGSALLTVGANGSTTIASLASDQIALATSDTF